MGFYFCLGCDGHRTDIVQQLLAKKQPEDKRKQQANKAAMQAQEQKQIYLNRLNNALNKLR